MDGVIAVLLYAIVYTTWLLLSCWFIGDAVKEFKNGNYYKFGLHVALSISAIVGLIKFVL